MRRKYERRYMIIISLFCFGIIIGSLFSNNVYSPINHQMQELEILVENFIQHIDTNDLPRSYLFTRAILTYGKQVFFIWLFGLYLVTLPLSCVFVIILGFSYGFTTSFFMIQYGFKGLLICLSAYGFQSTLFTCVIFLLLSASYSFAKKEKTITFKIYTIYLFIGMAFVILLSLYEAYIAPILIQHTIKIFMI